MCGIFRCYTQIIDQFHDIYVVDNLAKLSKCPLKFAVSRNSGKGVMHSNVYSNFLKIKLLLLFHETPCYLIDSLNLISLRYFAINKYSILYITICHMIIICIIIYIFNEDMIESYHIGIIYNSTYHQNRIIT